MKKMIGAAKMIAAAAAVSMLAAFPAFAMTARIAFTDPSAEVGKEVTVSMHVESTSGEPLGTANIMLEYDASALEFVSGDMTQGGAGSLRVSGQLTTTDKEWYYGLRFRPLKGGETDIKITSAELYDRDGKIATMGHTGSSHITVSGEAGETAAPSGEESAAAETAEPQAPSDLGVEIDGVKYEVTASFDASLLPRGYEAEDFSFRGGNVMAGKGPNDQLHLMYLLAEGGTGDLFLYDKDQDVWLPYVEVGMNAKTITAVPLDESAVPEELTASRLNLNGKMVDGWIGKEDQGQNFCVFYGMNAEGNKDFYRFDLKEKTIQRYFNEKSVAVQTETPAEDPTELEELKKKYHDRGILTLVLGALAAVLALVAVLLAAKKGGRPAEERPEIREERPERRQYVPSPEKELLEEEPVSEPEEEEIGEEISFDDASIEDAPVPEDFVQVEETVEEEAKKDEDDDDGFEDLEI
ncbi:MAG: hypothetical protein IJT43_10525 [Stomatobaculum sp.]|nr:hypothetical protein [Stomatobaculum sp.]